MTREEAIRILRYDIEVCTEEQADACLVAIKALEQQTCDDAISRADVKKYLSAPDANGDCVIYESDLDLLPPVTPQPKAGRWIRQTDDYHDYYECEQCGIAVGLDDIKNYCPNCGCWMEIEE